MDRIDGDGERTEADKNFYSTALELQKDNQLQNGCTQAEYQKKAFAYMYRTLCPTLRKSMSRLTLLNTSCG